VEIAAVMWKRNALFTNKRKKTKQTKIGIYLKINAKNSNLLCPKLRSVDDEGENRQTNPKPHVL